MESPSILSALAGSFHSRDLYRAVAEKWRGKAFLYLAVLVAVSCVLLGVSMYRSLSVLRGPRADEITRQIPMITITDGKVSVDVQQPYTITDPDTGTPIAIIDTTGTLTSLDGREASLLLMQSQVIINDDETTSETHDLSAVDSFSADGAMIGAWLAWVAAWGPIILFPFMLVGVFVFRIILALIHAVVGLLLNSIAGASLEFSAILSLSIVAATPAVALDGVLRILDVTLPNAWMLYFVLTIVCLYFAIAGTKPRPDDVAAGADPYHPAGFEGEREGYRP